MLPPSVIPPAGGRVGLGPASSGYDTSVAGEFHGWEGSTAYALNNGQVWQQSTYHYHYHYAYQPDVTIFGSSNCGSGYAMLVHDDDDEPVCVRRIR